MPLEISNKKFTRDNKLNFNVPNIENENDLFIKANVLLCDTEILNNYFSFQFKRLDEKSTNLEIHKNIKIVDDVYIFECYNNDDCIEFSKFYTNVILKECTTFLYFYNASFDKSVISILINLVKKGEKNILAKLKKASDYIVINNVDYKKVCNIHWKIIFDNDIPYLEKTSKIIESLQYENLIKFYNEFKHCLVNRADKKKINGNNINWGKILDTPQCNNKKLCSGTHNGKPLPIGLKTLQLILLDKQLKIDFDKYKSIEDIKKDNMYNTWLKYSSYDVISQEHIFNKYVKPDIINRYYAIKAINETCNFDYNLNAIFSQSNTELINYLFSIEDKKEIDFDYNQYIKSDNEDFNKLVEYCNNNKTITSKELSINYNNTQEITLNGHKCKIGLGGIHSKPYKYINKNGNMYDCDYASLYPNIIIMFKHLFKNIMNVDLYEKVLELRLKYKNLKKESKKQGNKDLENYYDKIQSGLKLLLNSTYGIINSVYGGIAYKPLGLFICLYGQSIAIKMINHNKSIKPYNVNTDGVYFEVPNNFNIKKWLSELIEDTKIQLESEKFKIMIQKDVNNYIAIDEYNNIRTKGEYNITFKNQINSCTRPISNNIENAINLIDNKPIEIKPIYFKNMKGLKETSKYYYTEDKTIHLIKNTKNPMNYLLNGKKVYITEDIKKASLNKYKEYGKITLDKIYKFDTGIETNKYYESELIEDTKENNKLKKQAQRKYKKLFNIDTKDLSLSGYKGNVKNTTFKIDKPITPLTNYTRTQILNSKETISLKLESTNKFIILDIDLFDKDTKQLKKGIDKNLIERLKKINTFKVWNDVTKNYNFKLIFENDLNIIYKTNENIKYIESKNESVIWSLDNPVRKYQDNNKKPLKASEYKVLLDNIFNIESQNANDYIEQIKNNKEKYLEFTSEHINIIKQILDNRKIKIDKIDKDKILLVCPYCQYYNTSHYQRNKNSPDTHVNINKANNSKGFSLYIHNYSNNCKEDKKHLEFNNEITNEFIDQLPSKEQMKRNELFNDIVNNIDIEELKKLDEKLLIPNTLRIVGTGGHKTFQSARKLIENVFIKKIFHIHSTKENKHIADFEREIKKILSMVLKNRTFIIDEWLNNTSKGLTDLNIHKLMSNNPLKKTDLNNLKGLITNHSYWYNNGHSSKHNTNMARLINHINTKNIKHEIVIDEYESFKRKGIISIPLNGYLYEVIDSDGQKTIKESPSCLYPSTEKTVKNQKISPFEVATEHTNVEMLEFDGIWKYIIKKEGQKNLNELIETYTEKTNYRLIDKGRRDIKAVIKDNYNAYIAIDVLTQLKLKKDIFVDETTIDFLNLLQHATKFGIVRKILRVGEKKEDQKIEDLKKWGYDINNLEELKQYGGILENENVSFSKFKDELKKEVGADLFIDRLLVYNKPTINMLNGKKYYLTANIPKNLTIPIDTSLAHKTSDHLKNIDVCIINMKNRIDTNIINSLHILKNKPFKSLVFTSLASNVNELQKKELDTSFIKIKGTMLDETGQKTKTLSYNTDDSENIDDNLKLTTTLGYINGTESQGRSYSQAEILILNTKGNVNVEGRIDVDKNNNFVIYDVIEESNDRIKQAIGRIFRGQQEYKCIICIGDVENTKDIFKSYPENFTIKFNVETYNKTTKGKFNKVMSDIINYYEHRLGYNKDEIAHFNKKITGLTNKKYNDDDIYNYYKNKVRDYYSKHKKRLKDNDILPEIIKKFGIADRQFKNIKRKFK